MLLCVDFATDPCMSKRNTDFAAPQKAGTALGRYGRAEEVAAAIAFLAHLRSAPPPEAVAVVAEGLAQEFARWEEMFA